MLRGGVVGIELFFVRETSEKSTSPKSHFFITTHVKIALFEVVEDYNILLQSFLSTSRSLR